VTISTDPLARPYADAIRKLDEVRRSLLTVQVALDLHDDNPERLAGAVAAAALTLDEVRDLLRAAARRAS
jgi:hypothetical protein